MGFLELGAELEEGCESQADSKKIREKPQSNLAR
jgi:hypothetical protein